MGRTRRILMSAAVLATALPAIAAMTQATDPAMGTWVLNVAKSKYDPGPGPKSLTRTYAATPNGYKFSSDGVNAAGEKTHVEFTVAFDGKYYPMTGNSIADSIMVKRVDANTVESTQKKDAKEVTHTTRVLSKDGKTLTSTAKGTNAEGKPYTNVEVFDKK
jgi:hypothetical protein